MEPKLCLVTGAAGFIGSHLTDRLLALGYRVIGIDNYRLGKRSNLERALQSAEFTLLEADVNDDAALLETLRPRCPVGSVHSFWHLAANSDIRAGTADPGVDLRDTFLTTFNSLKVMKALGIKRMAFASTSAIYGPKPGAVDEDAGPLQPISNYGAMKLAAEACISAAAETGLDRVWIFRFPNVVGGRATHGVIYDFLNKLAANPAELEVLGDGTQEKPYLHVSELVNAMVHVWQRAEQRYNVYNVGPDGPGTTVRYIAEAVVRAASPQAGIRYTGGDRGWPGDVPKFSYAIERLRSFGWAPSLTSRQAVDRCIAELVSERGLR